MSNFAREKVVAMKTINMDWMKGLIEDAEAKLHENVRFVTDDAETKGYLLYRDLRKQMDNFVINAANCGVDYGVLAALEHCITKDVCKYVSFEALYRLLFEDTESPPTDDETYQFIKDLYMRHLGITDENTLEMAEQYKFSGGVRYSPFSNNMWYAVNPIWPKYMTIEDKASFEKRKKKEALAEQTRKVREARQKKFEQEEVKTKWGVEEKQAFKLALEKQFGSSPEPDLKSQNQVQNHENSKSDK